MNPPNIGSKLFIEEHISIALSIGNFSFQMMNCNKALLNPTTKYYNSFNPQETHHNTKSQIPQFTNIDLIPTTWKMLNRTHFANVKLNTFITAKS